MDVDDDSSLDSDMEDADGEQSMRDEAEVESENLAEAFSDPRIARILTSIPQALPFSRRVKLFDSLLKTDKVKSQDEEIESRQLLLAMMRGEDADISIRPKIEIHRDRLYEDSMEQLNHLGSKLKRRIQVTFINQHGAQEAGIDGGGVFKEFLDDLIKDGFSIENSTTNHQLFCVTPLETLKVNSDLVLNHSLLSQYEFLGRVLGKAGK
jgi:ubiquitin-protein ligase E3 C